MNHEQVAQEWAEAYIKGSIAERWKIAEALEEAGIMAALVFYQLKLFEEFDKRGRMPAHDLLADMKAIAAGDDPPTSPACPEAKR